VGELVANSGPNWALAKRTPTVVTLGRNLITNEL
jgi:hypothetical protein